MRHTKNRAAEMAPGCPTVQAQAAAPRPVGIRHLKKFSNPASFQKAFCAPGLFRSEKGTLLR